MMPDRKVLSLLGLARRAGKLTWQEEANFSAIRAGTAKIVILAEDTGETVAKKYRDKSRSYRIPLYVFANKEELGQAIGASPRAAVAVLDEGFALQLQKIITE